ncbi:MAG: fibronectin type III domain-containing protein [Acidimicrobiales bacterium]
MKRRSVVRRSALVVTVASLTMALALSVSAAGASPVAAPHSVRASGTSTSILVRWSRPAGVAVKDYVVTSRPSNRSCVTKSTSCYVKGLRAGTRYTFSVVAKSSTGTSAPSAPSNHVRVATASAYFVNTLDVFGTQISAYETDYENAATVAKGQPYLTKLSRAFATFATALNLEAWPSGATSDLTAFIATIRSLGTDTINELNAKTTAGAQEATYTLQSDTNKEVLNEASVRTALSLNQLINPPIAVTPTAVALGTSQTLHDFFGDAFSVIASQIIDPAAAASDSGLPDSGYRFVAVDLSLVNDSNQEIDSDANFTTIVTGSDGQTYTADFGSVSQCGNFIEGIGSFQLPPGDSSNGCVIFEVPTSVNVATISFSLAPGYLDTAEWSG